ncbi:glycosyltransferase family 2 protein [Geomesophilobacter sediminis]|uniref:Glycosyltransferase 2-like domain-containing protein n=1 Tax=Geomesophilobacter sediminis TaxID=2798584 RepID=A0A8J7J9D2_9BACT|nr:glycosyltransferase family 2 protein [Geomesophilobacter sediminis]MBJ6723186.1 hypothetical protein [Geomesophilobacter sediminis]
MNNLLTKYVATRSVKGPWSIERCTGTGFAGAVVIPALSESERLFGTLDSLAANPPEMLERFLVLVVVNHREDATPQQKEDNRMTLERLRSWESPMNLAFIDAATPDRELPSRTGGVGLARKIGLDLALPRLAADGILICLDADTLVGPDYLRAISAHFTTSRCGGAVIPFRHQRGASEHEERAITLYELYLRHYVLGLDYAGSPYAFHTVGSAMACTARAYLRMGGMNSRCAGEDFYFLQQLKRTAGIEQVQGCTVHPAARSSWRVPFGTGKSIARLLAEGEDAVSFYRVECYEILKRWLEVAGQGLGQDGDALLEQAKEIHPMLGDYLADAGFPTVWDRLAANSKGADALTAAFHVWFDSLKTVRLIHHLSAALPRCRPEESVPHLLAKYGVDAPETESAQLEVLRHLQLGTGGFEALGHR